MAKIGIFYGSSTGNTESAAGKIKAALGADADEPKSIADVSADDLSGYDVLVLGTSTWGAGDLQDDWEDAIDNLDDVDMSGKKVALFGLGDAEEYPDTFVDGIGTIAEKVKAQGGTLIGKVATSGYSYDESTAVEGDSFVGLPLDEDNESEKTDGRIADWVAQIKGEM